MATLTPSPLRTRQNGKTSRTTTSAWLENVLDRPFTSYHLVLASAGLLLALGMLMVLSASSVKAYVNYVNSKGGVCGRKLKLVTSDDTPGGSGRADSSSTARSMPGRCRAMTAIVLPQSRMTSKTAGI